MTTITQFPEPPSRADPANFAARGDAFFGQFPTFVSQANAVANEVNANALTALANANTAASSASAAAKSELKASESAGVAAAFANQAAGTFTQGAIALLPKSVTTSQTIPPEFNAVSVGPLEIADGVTVTVSKNSTWSII